MFDVNRDTSVDLRDLETWVREIRLTYFGDAKLDGEFSSADLVSAFAAGEYEDDVPQNSSWATGDWNVDREFTSRDIVVAFEEGGYEQGPQAAAVPEPTALTFAGLAFLLCLPRRQM